MLLAYMTMMTIPWLKIYVISIIVSFCVGMMGYSYLDQAEVLPKKFPGWFSALLVSFIPGLNLLWAFSNLMLGIRVHQDPGQRMMIERLLANLQEQAEERVKNKFNRFTRVNNNTNDAPVSTSELKTKEDVIKKVQELEARIVQLENDDENEKN